MDLKTYMSQMDSDGRDDFASRCSTSKGHLQNVMYGFRPCSPELAVLIESNSAGAVTRRDLCENWKAIWPELIGTPGAPKVRKTQAAS